MNQYLEAECNEFCNRFPEQLALAEDIWQTTWVGKHWGPDGAIALSDSMYRTIGGVDELTQVMSSHYAAFGHAAKKIFSGNILFLPRVCSVFGHMLDAAKFLQHQHETKPLSLGNLQVLIAVYNRAGEVYKKIRLTEKSDDYFRKAYHLAKTYLSAIELSTRESSKILLYADMLSNPLVDINERQRSTEACNWYVNVQGTSVTAKICCLRALGKNEYAKLMAKELGLDDQVLKSA